MHGRKAFHVLFVCTGNICRSPMAEGLLRRELTDGSLADVRVSSAGVAAPSGAPASTHAVMACAELGVDISGHRSCPLSRALVESADLVLTMELHHLYATRDQAPAEAEKVHLLSQYAAGSTTGAPVGVEDPIGGDLEEYRHALASIRKYLKEALPRIQEEIRESVRET